MSQSNTPSGADVDVLAVLNRAASFAARGRLRAPEYSARQCAKENREDQAAIAAVAALIAERDSQKDRIRSVCQMIVAEIGAGCPCNLEDAAAKLIARNAELEAEREQYRADSKAILEHGVALAAENKALREDAERWREVERRFDSAKTSASLRVLEGLGIDDDEPWKSLARIVDLARKPAKENGSCDSAT